jgi:hypothetical protein
VHDEVAHNHPERPYWQGDIGALPNCGRIELAIAVNHAHAHRKRFGAELACLEASERHEVLSNGANKDGQLLTLGEKRRGVTNLAQ